MLVQLLTFEHVKALNPSANGPSRIGYEQVICRRRIGLWQQGGTALKRTRKKPVINCNPWWRTTIESEWEVAAVSSAIYRRIWPL